jgi:preprotein translocase subunit SecG
MYQFILLIHVFAAVFIIALVLVQQGKGATMGAAFGSGASQTVFGSRGSGSFLFRLTMSLAAIFFVTSLSLNYLTTHAFKQVKVIELPAVPASFAKPVIPVEASKPEKPPVTQPGDNIPTRTKK